MNEDQDRIKRRLAKVLALSQRGIGGEKTNAEAILKSGLAKHGLTIDDIGRDSNPLMHEVTKWYTYRTKHDKTILTQCMFKLRNVGGELEYKAMRGEKKIGYEATVLDHLEIDAMYSYYRKLYVEELELMMSAFISKHQLFCSESVGSDNVDLEQQVRVLEMMKGLRGSKFMTTRRRLESGR